MKTTKEVRKELKELGLFETLQVGNCVIMRCTCDYAIKNVNDEDDPMRDYSAYTYGFKLKWVIDSLLADKLIKEAK